MRLAHLVWPPDAWIAQAKLRELLRREGDGLVFVRREVDRLLNANSCNRTGYDSVDGVIRGVMQLCIDREIGLFERCVDEVRCRERRTKRNRAIRDEIDRTPQAHVLVGRTGVPVDPVDAEIDLRGREGFNRDGVFLAGDQVARRIELIGPIGSGDLLVVGNLFAVDPEDGPVVDAAEAQPESLSVLGCGDGKGLAIPPATAVWTVLGHGQVREVLPNGIVCAGNLAEIQSEVRLLDLSGCNLRGEYGRRY